jgi:hypothetical protein
MNSDWKARFFSSLKNVFGQISNMRAITGHIIFHKAALAKAVF